MDMKPPSAGRVGLAAGRREADGKRNDETTAVPRQQPPSACVRMDGDRDAPRARHRAARAQLVDRASGVQASADRRGLEHVDGSRPRHGQAEGHDASTTNTRVCNLGQVARRTGDHRIADRDGLAETVERARGNDQGMRPDGGSVKRRARWPPRAVLAASDAGDSAAVDADEARAHDLALAEIAPSTGAAIATEGGFATV